jgi:thiosulfate dehydrogenase (quinone) large subunit
MSPPLRVLRAFLGVTFVYAGMQKLLDPGFLHAGSATYIGTQLQGFAAGTPAAPLMRLLSHAPVLVGIATALTEIAVGVAVLLGIGLLAATAVGLAINVTLWLSATWHVHPYFMGSDSIYAVAWLSLLIASIGTRWPGARPTPTSKQRQGVPDSQGLRIERRELLRGGVVAGVSLAIALIADVFAAPWSGSSGAASGLAKSGVSSSGRPSSASHVATPSPSPSTLAGRTIASLDQLPIGKAVAFSAPGVGPAALVRLADGSVAAYSRVCTHAGCLVGWDAQAELLVCPCHGATFDPAHDAQPLPGSPTTVPLQMIDVEVDRATGAVILPN